MFLLETRRLTSKKASLEELQNGRFIQKTGFESSYVLTTLGRKLSRVRLVALVVDRFISDDEKYGAITLDDGTETMRGKVFVNVKMLEPFNKGDLVEVYGKIKSYNDETYVMPEILRRAEADLESLNMIELKKIYDEQKELIKKVKEVQKDTSDMSEIKSILKDISPIDIEGIIEAQEFLEDVAEETVSKTSDAKEKILELITEDGVDYEELIKKSGFSENIVDQTVQDLLETGICFEPRPGKIKKL